MLLLFLIATITGGEIVLDEARPVSPAGGVVSGDVVAWQIETWDCQLRPLDLDFFHQRLRDKGAPASILEDRRVRNYLDTLLPLEIAFRNKGTDPLVINPDQVVLLGRGTVTGRLIRTFDLLPVGAEPSPELEALAAVFSTATFQVPPGEVASRLLVFAPLGRRFPKRVTLVVNHLYQGSEDHRIECHFRVGYRKP